jgi:hypothetical protein
MRTFSTRSLAVAAFAAALLVASSCGGGLPGRGGKGGSVDPNACGNYMDVSDAGRKLHAFLEATATLERTVFGIEAEVRTACDAMARELGVDAKGSNKEVCDRVLAQLKEDLSAGVSANARLEVDYKPAVCTVNVDAAASVTAKCEARAEADIAVRCEATCTGTCTGACDGTCAGGTKGGECNGQCDGVCRGDCSGGCTGHANVDASAECQARGEVHATAEMKCTPAELNVQADASVVVDKPRADRAIAAIKAGMPQMLVVQAKVPALRGAIGTWVKTARGVSDAGRELAGQFKDQALCLTAQISAAAAAIAKIEASFSFSVEVSVEASGSAQVGG